MKSQQLLCYVVVSDSLDVLSLPPSRLWSTRDCGRSGEVAGVIHKERKELSRSSPHKNVVGLTPGKSESFASHGQNKSLRAAGVLKVIETSVSEFFGTHVSSTVPLVSAGLDSISATELSRILGERLNTQLPATLFFDYPSMLAVSGFVDESGLADVSTLSACDSVSEGTLPTKSALTSISEAPQAISTRRDERGTSNDSDVLDAASRTLEDLLGTKVAADVPLMSVGLDSISATEFTRLLSEKIGRELPATLLFDHPSIGSIASFLGSSNSPAKLEVSAMVEPRSMNETLPQSPVLQASSDLRGARKMPVLCGTSYEVPAGVNYDDRLSEVVCRGLVGAT